MQIEAQDGRYYLDPLYERDNCVVHCLDECIWLDLDILSKPGPNHMLKLMGIKANWVEAGDSSMIIAGEYRTCHRYQLFIKQPLPVPIKSIVSDYPEPGAYVWSLPVSLSTILGIMAGTKIDDVVYRLLGLKLRAAIRRQLPYLKGARITPDNLASYYRQCEMRYGHTIRLKRKDPIQL